MKSNEDNKNLNFQYFGTKHFFMFKTSLLLFNFCLCVYEGAITNHFNIIQLQFHHHSSLRPRGTLKSWLAEILAVVCDWIPNKSCHCIWSGYRCPWAFVREELHNVWQDSRYDHKTSSITISSVHWRIPVREAYLKGVSPYGKISTI